MLRYYAYDSFCLNNFLISQDYCSDLTVRIDSYKPPVGLRIYWWGWALSIDNNTTLDIVDYLSGGAYATTIAAALAAGGVATSPAVIPLGVIAGVIGLGAVTINIVNRHGGYKGVYFTGYWGTASYTTMHARY